MAIYYKQMEPVRAKLWRWVLHENNLAPDSLKETIIPDSYPIPVA